MSSTLEQKPKRRRRVPLILDEHYVKHFKSLESLCKTALEIGAARRASDVDRIALYRVLMRLTAEHFAEFAKAVETYERELNEEKESE